MKIAHIALWVNDLEKMTGFYCRFFNGTPGKIYRNPAKNFISCFVSFKSGTTMELMSKTDQVLISRQCEITTGFHHLAFSVGTRDEVDSLTLLLHNEGYEVKSNPRFTGDGYYESVVSDPEGNTIEITV